MAVCFLHASFCELSLSWPGYCYKVSYRRRSLLICCEAQYIHRFMITHTCSSPLPYFLSVCQVEVTADCRGSRACRHRHASVAAVYKRPDLAWTFTFAHSPISPPPPFKSSSGALAVCTRGHITLVSVDASDANCEVRVHHTRHRCYEADPAAACLNRLQRSPNRRPLRSEFPRRRGSAPTTMPSSCHCKLICLRYAYRLRLSCFQDSKVPRWRWL